jgi:hypothetical protein
MKADEKSCPQCAETIKKAATICRYCGYRFSPEELARQKKADSRRVAWGCLPIIVIVGLIAITSSNRQGSTSHPEPSGGTPAASTIDTSERIAFFQTKAKEAMTDALRDPGSAQYKDVTAHVFPEDHKIYVFCGYVNSKNGFGGYTGFKPFVAGAGIAATSEIVSDFSNLWNKLCTSEGTSVWF